MTFYRHFHLHRTLCDVLTEIRSCHKTRNYAVLLSLVEEAQSMGNRMESKLETINEFEDLYQDVKRLRKEYKELQTKLGASS